MLCYKVLQEGGLKMVKLALPCERMPPKSWANNNIMLINK